MAAWKRSIAAAWAEAKLRERGLELRAALQPVHAQPWSRVWRAPTGSGDVYLKAVAPAYAFEAGLTAYLAARWPEFMPPLLAAEAERGWLLMGDGGPRLREFFESGGQIERWEPILRRYARVQVALADELGALERLGVPDRRPGRLTAFVERLIDEPMDFGFGFSERLSTRELNQLRDCIPVIRDVVAELLKSPVPASLEHGDLHDGNIFLRDGLARLFDWGDASLSHPFFSLRTTSVSLENTFGLEENAPQHRRLARVYLEAWSEAAAIERLQATFELAQRLAPLAAAWRWHMALSLLGPRLRGDYAHVLPSLMREFLSLREGWL